MWATFLSELWRWAAEHDGGRVPTTAVTSVNGERFMLGSRVKNARVYHRRGTLTPQQVAQLEAVPGWSWSGYAGFSANVWEHRIAELQAYVDQHGSLARIQRRDPSLTVWLRKQRLRTDLTTGERAQLAAIPDALSKPNASLDELIDAIRRWMAETGLDAGEIQHATVFDVDGQETALGGRVWRQKRQHAAGKLPTVDAARLETLPGWTWETPKGRPGRRSGAQSLVPPNS